MLTQIAHTCFSDDENRHISGERDIAPELRERVLSALRLNKAADGWLCLVSEVVELDAADQKRAFGEALPPGLRLLD